MKKQPSNPLAWNVKGVVYSSQRDYAAARASFDQALKLDPGYVAAAYNLAQLDLVQRNPDAARKGYERILAKDPRNEQALLAIASLLGATRAPTAEVKAAIERAINANPSSVRARLALINYYAQQRDAKGALAAAQAANSAIPDNLQLLDILGSAQQAAGENNQALETMARAVKLQPENPLPLLRLAGVQATLKDYDASIATLRKAIALQPGAPQFVARTLRRLPRLRTRGCGPRRGAEAAEGNADAGGGLRARRQPAHEPEEGAGRGQGVPRGARARAAAAPVR